MAKLATETLKSGRHLPGPQIKIYFKLNFDLSYNRSCSAQVLSSRHPSQSYRHIGQYYRLCPRSRGRDRLRSGDFRHLFLTIILNFCKSDASYGNLYFISAEDPGSGRIGVGARVSRLTSFYTVYASASQNIRAVTIHHNFGQTTLVYLSF